MIALLASLMLTSNAHATDPKPQKLDHVYTVSCAADDSASPRGVLANGSIRYDFHLQGTMTDFNFALYRDVPGGGEEETIGSSMHCDLGERKCVGFDNHSEILTLPYTLGNRGAMITVSLNDRTVVFSCPMPVPDQEKDPANFCESHPGNSCQLQPGGARFGVCCRNVCVPPWVACM